MNAKSTSNSDDDYDKFCNENFEPVITVKRKDRHFIFEEFKGSYSPLNKIINKIDSFDDVSAFFIIIYHSRDTFLSSLSYF